MKFSLAYIAHTIEEAKTVAELKCYELYIDTEAFTASFYRAGSNEEAYLKACDTIDELIAFLEGYINGFRNC